MRRYVVFVLLLGMVLASVLLLAVRSRGHETVLGADAGLAASSATAADAAAEANAVLAGSEPGAAHTPSPTTAGKATSGTVAASAPSIGEPREPGVAPAGKEPLLHRPLRVVGLGWELLVPGIMANGGTTAGAGSLFEARGLDVVLRSVAKVSDVERALARGGGDEKGADIAIVPLPSMVASYEALRALEPQVLFVVGWSHGRDALYATSPKTLLNVPARGDVEMLGVPGEPATFLGLFLLDAAGVAPKRVILVPPYDSVAGRVAYAAVDRTAKDAAKRSGKRKVLVTTADAMTLIPYVAIGPKGFLGAHTAAVNAWLAAWLEGAGKMAGDVPASARMVAGSKGAPEAVSLLRNLGQLVFAGLSENARLLGLSGRRAVTVEELFSRSWALWRGVGVLSTPAPEAAPLSTNAVVSLALADSGSLDPDEGIPKLLKRSFAEPVVLRHRLPAGRLDEGALVKEIGLLGGVFGRSGLRVGALKSKPRTAAIIAGAVERFALVPEHLQVLPRITGPGVATIEVLAAP